MELVTTLFVLMGLCALQTQANHAACNRPCENGGFCTETCWCPEGYQGYFCDDKRHCDRCQNVVVKQGGVIVEEGDKPDCLTNPETYNDPQVCYTEECAFFHTCSCLATNLTLKVTFNGNDYEFIKESRGCGGNILHTDWGGNGGFELTMLSTSLLIDPTVASYLPGYYDSYNITEYSGGYQVHDVYDNDLNPNGWVEFHSWKQLYFNPYN